MAANIEFGPRCPLGRSANLFGVCARPTVVRVGQPTLQKRERATHRRKRIIPPVRSRSCSSCGHMKQANRWAAPIRAELNGRAGPFGRAPGRASILSAYRMPEIGQLRQSRAVHSITRLRRRRTDCGMVIPRVLAVLRLATSSNLVGSSMGSSAGRAPLRIRSM
jgi:hypothetical protein